MARVTIDLPETFNFSIELPVLISHINRGDHLGNEHLIALLNEARLAFMRTRGVTEVAPGKLMMVNADLAVVYQSEVKYGESLRIEVEANAFHGKGCDIVYRVTEAASTRPVAQAKTAHLLIDPELGKAVLAPEGMLAKLAGETSD